MPIVVSDKSSFAAESGHWYKPDGKPAYTVIGANGKERATTLRDARKLGLVPSVTTILRSAARPGLERWKAEQLLMSALTLQQMPGESETSWVGRVWQDSIQQAIKAAERGTQIHAAIESQYAGVGFDPKDRPWVESIETLLEQTFGPQQWLPEKSFASPLGYGGKVDLHSDSVLIDFKGKEHGGNWQVYDEHAMQLAAYALGLGLKHGSKWPTCGIVFFDRDQPYCEWHEVKTDKLERGWRMFEALLTYWKAANL